MDRKENVRRKMAEVLGLEPERVVDDAVLTDLVSSSFVLVEMVIEVQEEFGVRFGQADLSGVTTVAQFLELVAARMAAAVE